MGHWTQGHGGVGHRTLNTRSQWCRPSDTGDETTLVLTMGHGHEATLAFVWDTGQAATLVLFASWPLEAAAVFAVTSSCLRSWSTLGALPGQHGWTGG